MENRELKEEAICQRPCGKVEIGRSVMCDKKFPVWYFSIPLTASLLIISHMHILGNRTAGGGQWGSHSGLSGSGNMSGRIYNLQNFLLLALPLMTPIKLK